MNRLFSVLGLLSLGGHLVSCAEKSGGLKGTAAGERAAAAGQKGGVVNKDDTTQTAKREETPVFTRSKAPISLRCDAPADVSFKLSDQLSPTNVFLLSRFANIGAAALPFDPISLPKWLNGVGFAQVKLLESKAHGVQGFVATSERMNLVVFRGTHSLEGVLTDSKFLIQSALTDGLPGGVHQGFGVAYRSVASVLGDVLVSKERKSLPTFFVGHSLGGALATLASLDMNKRGVNVSGVVTLGEPRVGNSTFAAESEKILVGKKKRFVNANDVVPHLPPSGQHADTAINSILDPATRGTTLAILSGISVLSGMTFAKANFTHIGVPATLGAAEYSKDTFVSDAAWDGKYWSSNGAKVQQVVANPAAATQNPLVNDHFVENYLCEMLKSLPQ
jgi:hypothetical protein